MLGSSGHRSSAVGERVQGARSHWDALALTFL